MILFTKPTLLFLSSLFAGVAHAAGTSAVIRSVLANPFLLLLSPVIVAQRPPVDYTDGPLEQPQVLESKNGKLAITLKLMEADHETVIASEFHTRLLGGTLPGPTLAINPGDWLKIEYKNKLEAQEGVNETPNQFSHPDHSNLHFHGAHVSGELPSDDVTFKIAPGDEFKYKSFFPEFHMPGTHWIHPHAHGSTTLQVGAGAAAALIVKDPEGSIPPEVEAADDVLLFVQNFRLAEFDEVTAESGDQLLSIVLEQGVRSSFRLVNGQYRPSQEIVAGALQRWRVVFASWDRDPLDMVIENADGSSDAKCEMFLLAKDGIYIRDYPRLIGKAPVPTAGRADIMVRCDGPGEFNVVAFDDREILMTLTSAAPEGDVVLTELTSDFPFDFPSYLTDLRLVNPTNGCSCETDMGGDDEINGMVYDPDLFIHTVALGSVVERELRGIDAHAYHQHVYPFQLQDDLDGIDAEDGEYFKPGDYHDVLLIRSVQATRVKYQALGHTGKIMVHCHRLIHEDKGMMSKEDVVDPADGGTCQCTPRRGATADNGWGFTRPPTPSPTPKPFACEDVSGKVKVINDNGKKKKWGCGKIDTKGACDNLDKNGDDVWMSCPVTCDRCDELEELQR